MALTTRFTKLNFFWLKIRAVLTLWPMRSSANAFELQRSGSKGEQFGFHIFPGLLRVIINSTSHKSFLASEQNPGSCQVPVQQRNKFCSPATLLSNLR